MASHSVGTLYTLFFFFFLGSFTSCVVCHKQRGKKDVSLEGSAFIKTKNIMVTHGDSYLLVILGLCIFRWIFSLSFMNTTCPFIHFFASFHSFSISTTWLFSCFSGLVGFGFLKVDGFWYNKGILLWFSLLGGLSPRMQDSVQNGVCGGGSGGDSCLNTPDSSPLGHLKFS